jgi:hypothetical protein
MPLAHPSGPSSASFRFLLFGGWTAIKSASVGSILAVFATLMFAGVYAVWQNGLQAIEFNFSGLASLLSSAAFLLPVALLLSIMPAFIGGVLLAWLIKRQNSNSSPGKMNLGAWIGASAGAVLTLLVLIPTDFVGRHAHGGYGYSLLESLPRYVFFAAEFIVIATIAGRWTERQIRRFLRNAIPKWTD